jgi:hypothetical protein
MENNYSIVLISTVIFNLVLVIAAMVLVRRVKSDQRRRQRSLVDQGKINASLQKTVELKNKTLENYQRSLRLF